MSCRVEARCIASFHQNAWTACAESVWAHRQRREDAIDHLDGLDEYVQLTRMECKFARSFLQEPHLPMMQGG